LGGVAIKMVRGIKAISFYGDQTLLDFEEVIRHPLACVFEKLEKIKRNVSALFTEKK
jgi:hypothetical protein